MAFDGRPGHEIPAIGPNSRDRTNVARHAHARHADLSIAVGETRERATELGGSFELTAPPSGGTLLRVVLPLPSP
jgi:signal transduction histidine kinase